MRFQMMATPTVAAALLTAAAAPAHAQAVSQGTATQATPTEPTAPDAPATANGGQQSDDIVVTATRQETLLQNTPVAVTALNAKTLEQRGVRSLLDIGNYVPNLSIGTRGSQGSAQGGLNLRGMGSDAPDSSPSVGIYIDDVYYPSVSGNLLGLFDVARVEVLRGPQGTLFGRNTIAGAVQYVGVKPTVDTFSGFAFASGGTGTKGVGTDYEFSGAVNAPIGSTLAVRISGQVRQQGGYIDDQLNGVKRGRDYTEQGRVQLRWQPSSDLTIDLKGETTKVRDNGRPVTVNGFDPSAPPVPFLIATGAIPLLPPPFVETNPLLPGYIASPRSRSNAGFNQPDFFRLRYNAGNGVIAYNLTDDIQLKSISAYSFTRTQTSFDFDDTPLSIEYSNSGTVRTKLFTQEVKLSGNSFKNRFHWTTGLYYYDSKQNVSGAFFTLGRVPPGSDPRTETKVKSYAAYGQATLDIVGGLSATGGLRYSHEQVRGIYPDGQHPESKRSFNDTSPYFGLNFQANPDALLYVKASKGFRAGGFTVNPNYPTGTFFFGPETAWTYEAGARLQFLDRRLRFNPTIFQTNWKNIQFAYISLQFPAPGAPPATVAGTQNAGNARLRGAELESQFAVTPAFQLTGSFSYLDARYTRLNFINNPLTIPVILSKSDSLARAPKFKYSVGGRYTLEMGDGSQAVVSADYAWTDNQRSSVDRDQAVTLPHYGLLSARVEFTPAGKNFTFAIYGTNLTDKYYLIDGINFRSNSGFLINTLGRPREIGASARINF